MNQAMKDTAGSLVAYNIPFVFNGVEILINGSDLTADQRAVVASESSSFGVKTADSIVISE
jgi:hypothetical protein